MAEGFSDEGGMLWTQRERGEPATGFARPGMHATASGGAGGVTNGNSSGFDLGIRHSF